LTDFPFNRVYLSGFSSDKNVQLSKTIECSIEYDGFRFQNGSVNPFSGGSDCFLETKRAAAKHIDGLSKMGAAVYCRRRTTRRSSFAPSYIRRGQAIRAPLCAPAKDQE
jgi:hypothetical protein